MSSEDKKTKDNESKLEKWTRLAKARHTALMKKFTLLKNLGNSNYAVDVEQAERMLVEIEYETRQLRLKWKIETPSSGTNSNVAEALEDDDEE
jgi:hypothetical protein